MIMWAFAKLDHTPSPKFSAGVLARFNDSLEDFSPQVRYHHDFVVRHVQPGSAHSGATWGFTLDSWSHMQRTLTNQSKRLMLIFQIKDSEDLKDQPAVSMSQALVNRG